MPNLVLIDDNEANLQELTRSLTPALAGQNVEIRQWVPRPGDVAERRFEELVNLETGLVITDYNLTDNGLTGLFGSTIVAWCQAKAIPVGDYSRAIHNVLPEEPNQYEIRIPANPELAAPYIAGTFRGFLRIRQALDAAPRLLTKKRSPVSVLSEILGRPEEESRFALYGSRVGASNSALIRLVTAGGETRAETKRRYVSYLVGHLLLNAILRYPGPILNRSALTAYLAVAESEITKIEPLFTNALYSGPFSDIENYYWLSDVDIAFAGMDRNAVSEDGPETVGQLNREAVEAVLKTKLVRHGCSRCQGLNGGFICPFTHRAVCQLPTCSVGPNSWIPQGARLCRIEKDFYDEWAPMLGF